MKLNIKKQTAANKSSCLVLASIIYTRQVINKTHHFINY